ncbi:hypothetical protein MAP00_003114 [Monascus purpureus]|nr:hypothetical protein MAP00_003114 [Monascus purpureus]
MEQANRLLHQYRTKMVPYFPFFVIPSRATAEEIRRDRPFVFLAILATASYESMPLQRRLECEMKEMLSQCMIFGRKITFDTLQGLLIYLAWSQYHARPRRYFQLLHLAVSVIVDFELDKPLASRSQISRLEVGSKSSRDIGSRWSWGEEEQRAVVACYYLSSSLSVLLQKTCAFVHTDYIIDCCRALSRDAEYASDRYLEHIIRLQAIFEKVDALSFRHASELHREGAGLEERIVQLQAELEAYRDALPCALEDDLLLFFKYHTANLYLCQILFFDHSAPTTTTTWTPSRLEILNNGLLTSRTSLHFFLSLPPRTEMSVTNSLWVQVGFTLVTATRLAVTAASAVSALSSEQPCSHANTSSNNATATIARTTTLSLLESLDMHSILCDTTVRLRGLVSSVADEKGDRDLWFHTDKWLQRVREWFERSYSGLSNGTVAHTDEMDPSRHAGGPGGPGPSHGSHTHGISAFSPVGVQQYAPFPGGYYDDANAMLFSGWFGFGPAMDDANLMWLGV